jgi:hypothetical protein
MNLEEKIKYLKKEIDDRIKDFAHKRKRDKNKAFGLKIIAVVLAAAITVLLGLKVDENWAKVFQNIALVFGATITILNAVEAFYDHRSLWIRRTVTLAHLFALERDLSLYIAGTEQTEIDPKVLNRLADRYDRILADDLKAWLQLREYSAPTSEAQAKR